MLDSSFFEQVESIVQHEEIKNAAADGTFEDSKVYQQMLKDFLSTSADTPQVNWKRRNQVRMVLPTNKWIEKPAKVENYDTRKSLNWFISLFLSLAQKQTCRLTHGCVHCLAVPFARASVN